MRASPGYMHQTRRHCLKDINERTRFESFFTEDEYLYIDRFIKDDAVSESSFVVQESAS